MSFLSQSADLKLYRAQIDLWKETIGSDTGHLSKLELLRYKRFKVAEKKEQYLVSSLLTRIILSSYLGISPQQVPISYSSNGKPLLPNHEINFNLSHSGNQFLLLVSKSGTCGVDIQNVFAIQPSDRFINNVFHKEEIAYLKTFQGKPDYQDQLFSLWTAKEAYLKAIGAGIIDYPQWLGMLPDPLQRGRFKIIAGVSQEDRGSWTVCSLNSPQGYQAAYAFNGQVSSFREFDFTPGDQLPAGINSSYRVRVGSEPG
jgi:4'-phosphopantetheinyl transferase